MQDYYILAINTGSTSTKLALYKNDELLYKDQCSYPVEQLAPFPLVKDQFALRLEGVQDFLESMPVGKEKLSAVACRGGTIVPLQAGAYKLNDLMIDRLLNRPLAQQPANLSGPLGYDIAKELGIDAYIYDGITVGELQPLAYPTGIKGVVRQSRVHALNMRAMMRREARNLGKTPEELNLIIAHIGGGITACAMEKGRMIDVVNDTEGPYTNERSGRMQLHQLAYYCIDNGIAMEQVPKLVRGKSGMSMLLGTSNALEVEKLVDDGDRLAALVYEAMAYQIAKSIGEMATVLKGAVDRIVLTGAIANSKRLTGWVIDRVKFIADVDVLPGEDEMEALANGVLRVVRGEEQPHAYTEEVDSWEERFSMEQLLDEYASAPAD